MGSVGTSIFRETSTPTRTATRSTDYTLVREEPDIKIAEHFVENIDLRADAASWEQAPGAEFHASTVNGYFRVEGMSDGHVDVSYLLRVVVDGAVDPTNVGFATVSLDWREGGWVITGEPDGADSKTMRETGTAFTGGC